MSKNKKALPIQDYTGVCMKKDPHSNLVLVTVSLLFFAMGILTAGFGPLMSEFSSNTGASLAAVGGLFTAVFCGALLAQLIGGVLSEKIGMVLLSIFASVFLSAGLAGMTFSRSLPVLLITALFAGLGHGTLNLAGNVMIATLFREKSVTAVNFVNIFFGIGAVIGPALVSVSLRILHFGMPALWIAALFILIAAGYLVKVRRGMSVRNEEQAAVPGRALLRSPLLWVLGVMALIYVGTENAVGGWTTTYLQETLPLSLEDASLVTACFWLALTLGRMICAWLGARLSALRVLAVSFALSMVGVILFVAGIGSAWMSILSVFVMGVGFGGVYPTALALTTGQFSQTPGKAGAVITAMGSIGGMLIPLMLGVVIDTSGPKKTGYLLASLILALVVIYGFARKQLQQKISA